MFAFMLALMFGLPLALTIGVRRHSGHCGRRPRVIVVPRYGLRFGSLRRAISVLLRCLRNRSFRGEPVQRSMGVTIVGRSRLFVRRVGLLTVGIIGILRPLRSTSRRGTHVLLKHLGFDTLLFARRKLLERRRTHAIVRQPGRSDFNALAECLTHFGTHNVHDLGGAVDFFLGHGQGERIFAQCLIEFQP